jgi:CheY-like chemotaxis protein
MSTDKPTVLYVEDDPRNFEVAELRLGKRFRLLHAADDRAAYRLFEEYQGQLTAILMDVELQGSALDGLALTRLLRGTLPVAGLPDYAKAVKPRKTPVIIVTAYVGQYSPPAVKEVGADNFFAKPVDFVKLSLALATISARAAIDTLTQA